MGRYKLEWNQNHDRIPGAANIMVTDAQTGTTYKVSKKCITQGFPVVFDQELCDQLFAIDDMFYKQIPVEFRTEAMTEHMIEKYKLTYYAYFPPEYHTEEKQKQFFHEMYDYLRPNIEEGIITRDFGRYSMSYKRHGERIHAIGKVKVTNTETGEVVEITKSNIRKHTDFLTQELCDALCEIDDLFYKRIPVEYRSEELTQKMIKKYYDQLYEYYPEKYRHDRSMTVEYARKVGGHFFYIPEDMVDQNICDIFVFANPRNLGEIPEQFVKQEHIDRIRKKGLHLGNVPLEYRSVDVCMQFVKSHPGNIGFIPDAVLPEICDRLGYEQGTLYNEAPDSFWMRPKEKVNQFYLDRKKD